ncbi:hypothetical protein SNEBB_009884 [Seison nebaliae]|nr:hypothetical protein SNEBB_009884 [Seison nebaliae]
MTSWASFQYDDEEEDDDNDMTVRCDEYDGEDEEKKDEGDNNYWKRPRSDLIVVVESNKQVMDNVDLLEKMFKAEDYDGRFHDDDSSSIELEDVWSLKKANETDIRDDFLMNKSSESIEEENEYDKFIKKFENSKFRIVIKPFELTDEYQRMFPSDDLEKKEKKLSGFLHSYELMKYDKEIECDDIIITNSLIGKMKNIESISRPQLTTTTTTTTTISLKSDKIQLILNKNKFKLKIYFPSINDVKMHHNRNFSNRSIKYLLYPTKDISSLLCHCSSYHHVADCFRKYVFANLVNVISWKQKISSLQISEKDEYVETVNEELTSFLGTILNGSEQIGNHKAYDNHSLVLQHPIRKKIIAPLYEGTEKVEIAIGQKVKNVLRYQITLNFNDYSSIINCFFILNENYLIILTTRSIRIYNILQLISSHSSTHMGRFEDAEENYLDKHPDKIVRGPGRKRKLKKLSETNRKFLLNIFSSEKSRITEQKFKRLLSSLNKNEFLDFKLPQEHDNIINGLCKETDDGKIFFYLQTANRAVFIYYLNMNFCVGFRKLKSDLVAMAASSRTLSMVVKNTLYFYNLFPIQPIEENKEKIKNTLENAKSFCLEYFCSRKDLEIYEYDRRGGRIEIDPFGRPRHRDYDIFTDTPQFRSLIFHVKSKYHFIDIIYHPSQSIFIIIFQFDQKHLKFDFFDMGIFSNNSPMIPFDNVQIETKTVISHKSGVNVAFCQEGILMVVQENNNVLHFLDLPQMKKIETIELNGKNESLHLQFSLDNRYLFIYEDNRIFRLLIKNILTDPTYRASTLYLNEKVLKDFFWAKMKGKHAKELRKKLHKELLQANAEEVDRLSMWQNDEHLRYVEDDANESDLCVKLHSINEDNEEIVDNRIKNFQLIFDEEMSGNFRLYRYNSRFAFHLSLRDTSNVTLTF